MEPREPIDPPQPGQPSKPHPIPCATEAQDSVEKDAPTDLTVTTIKIPVPAGTVNLLDPKVIERMNKRGAEQNAYQHKLRKDDL